MQCKACEAKNNEVSARFLLVWRMYKLAQGGYPFGQEDLPLDIWEDIAEVKEHMEAYRLGWRTRQS